MIVAHDDAAAAAALPVPVPVAAVMATRWSAVYPSRLNSGHRDSDPANRDRDPANRANRKHTRTSGTLAAMTAFMSTVLPPPSTHASRSARLLRPRQRLWIATTPGLRGLSLPPAVLLLLGFAGAGERVLNPIPTPPLASDVVLVPCGTGMGRGMDMDMDMVLSVLIHSDCGDDDGDDEDDDEDDDEEDDDEDEDDDEEEDEEEAIVLWLA
jgi:hypothetical protein